MKHFFSLLLLFTAHFPGTAQEGWILKKDKEGIKIFNRTSDHSKFNDLRVTTSIKGRLSDLAAVILDIGGYRQWSYNTKKSYVLKKVSPSELYFYSEINSPWPASNRDLIVHLHITQDPLSRVMTIQADNVPDYIPARSGIIRVPFSKERWIVTPENDTALLIEYELQIDPGASVPAWLINTFSATGPYETFTGLRRQIGQEKYRNAIISFIKD